MVWGIDSSDYVPPISQSQKSQRETENDVAWLYLRVARLEALLGIDSFGRPVAPSAPRGGAKEEK